MGYIYTQMLPKALTAGASPGPNPHIARAAPFALASLTRRVENGVIAIQKWVPYTPKCSQKALVAGALPQTPNSEEERLRRTPRGRGANSHPHLGRRNPRYATAIIKLQMVIWAIDCYCYISL